jgi:hypothetical protein
VDTDLITTEDTEEAEDPKDPEGLKVEPEEIGLLRVL